MRILTLFAAWIVFCLAALTACGGGSDDICQPATAEELQTALIAIAHAQQSGDAVKILQAQAEYQALMEHCK